MSKKRHPNYGGKKSDDTSKCDSDQEDNSEFHKKKKIDDMVANMVITDKNDKKPYFVK